MEILNKTEIMNPPEIWFMFVIIVILSFLLMLITSAFDLEGVSLAIACIFLIGLFGFIITSFFEGTSTGRYKYEVILDKSYSATELYENYDVIEQRGQIWVIKDKELE